MDRDYHFIELFYSTFLKTKTDFSWAFFNDKWEGGGKVVELVNVLQMHITSNDR